MCFLKCRLFGFLGFVGHLKIRMAIILDGKNESNGLKKCFQAV